MTKTRDYKLIPVQKVVSINALCSAFSATREAGYYHPGEAHDFYEILFVTEGEAVVTAGETVYTLKEGQVIIHPPMQFHRHINDSDHESKITILSFSADAFPITGHRICVFPSSAFPIHLVKELREIYNTDDILLTGLKDPSFAPMAQTLINSLENYLITLLGAEENFPVPANDRGSKLYTEAVAVMHRHIGEPLKAGDIAGACSISVSALQKIFIRYTGMGLMHYFTLLKMRSAKERLETGERVKTVSDSLGFDNQNYFSTVFHRTFGISPSSIKQKKIGKAVEALRERGQAMKYNLKNCRDGSPATYPTTVEIGERDGILTFTFEAGHSGYYCPYPGYNGAHSSGDAVEILIGSDPERKRYYEIELSPRGDQMLARIEYKGEKNEAPVIEVYPVETSFLTTSVTRQNDGYRGVISFSKQNILTGEGEIFFNAYRLDTDGGAETDRHLFALVPTLRPKFHTPRFFARLSDFVKEN